MMKLDIVGAALVAILCIGAVGHARPLQATAAITKPVIVLVHGAFADGSIGARVVSILIADGYQVVAVQNPCTSLADDVAATDRVLRRQTRPVVLVGHSWGGGYALSYVAAHPGCAGVAVQAALGFRHHSQVSRLLARLERTQPRPDGAGHGQGCGNGRL